VRWTRVTRRRLRTGLLFLAPNICGFLMFTMVPLVLSFALAFTNWDVRRHNMFRGEDLEFIGLQNFEQLFTHPAFWQYLGNTLFLMLGIPFAVAGSLIAALLLTQDLKKKSALRRAHFLAGVVLVCSIGVLFLLGFRPGSLQILIALLFLTLLASGWFGGTTVYRTIFYAPHFTAGVATFLLWKKMYNPQTGPINEALRPVVSTVESVFRFLPAEAGPFLAAVVLLLGLLPLILLHRKLGRAWLDAELGRVALICLSAVTLLPLVLGWRWLGGSAFAVLTVLVVALSLLWHVVRPASKQPFRIVPPTQGMAPYLIPLGGAVGLSLACAGLSLVALRLPVMAATGMAPPNWLADYHWAKPAIMIMAFWAAVGSNNMILYIAGLTNVPQELYDAADIDGASRLQRFWNVTWPQLAPVTFFIVIMSVINGLQGGFEMARTMTQGGPAGATTTLSYFVFIEGFETGRLGYASAVVWTLFVLVMAVTIVNFKFGNRYVND
jgi:multiple sugar transport system permease protein